MSSQKQLALHLSPQPLSPRGEVDHTRTLSEHVGSLCLDDKFSDIVLKIEGQRIHAHKVILAARSDYFRALFFGGCIESQRAEIELQDISADAFRVLLKYIYTGRVNLTNVKEDLIRDLLGLAHQYAFAELETAISDFLESMINTSNVCLIYDVAWLYSRWDLVHACRYFLDRHAGEILQHDSFLQLSKETLEDILSRDSFCAPEVDIFRGLLRWMSNQSLPKTELTSLLKTIRLPLMSLPELLNEVRPSDIISADAILDALEIKTKVKDSELAYRGHLLLEENVACPQIGAQVIQGEMRIALLDGDVTNYDMERGFTRHPIEDGNAGIVVMLGMPCIINHLKLLLWDKDVRSYSYFIEVSMDRKDWVRVVDHTNYMCRSWQRLYFTPRVARYIRVVGTHNTVNRVFHAVALEAYYTQTSFKLDRGLIVPQHNVATVELGAIVLEGVSRTRNVLLNGDTVNYDWDSGYTCHQLGSGSIVVQLAQPYFLDSLRLLLWDCDERRYGYCIEVSTNYKEWVMIADKRREGCRSWQTLKFSPVPVVYIKITGTQNTANDVFHCVHLECPAQESTELKMARESKERDREQRAGEGNSRSGDVTIFRTFSALRSSFD